MENSSQPSYYISYYQKNKDRLLESYKKRKPYLSFYQKHRDRLRQQALERYYIIKLQNELLTSIAQSNELNQTDDYNP